MSRIQPSAVSVFDMLKIGLGPSSSHTLGPWRAIQRWINEDLAHALDKIERLQIHLYGSLALTGKGHYTDKAICLALLGHDPEHVPIEQLSGFLEGLNQTKKLQLGGNEIAFDPAKQIIWHPQEQLPQHTNGMRCQADGADLLVETNYYSIGGGFVLKQGESPQSQARETPPYPAQTAQELLAHCANLKASIADVVRRNESFWHGDDKLSPALLAIWRVMLQAIHKGCSHQGELPGGLHVARRAQRISQQLLGQAAQGMSAETWRQAIEARKFDFNEVLQWLSCFALAVNEENAAMGRIVTAPTNGAAGVIPAVLMYHLCFNQSAKASDIERFLLVAGEIGTYFKKGATISAAQGGCQAEIGVSSAMAAAALTEVVGGSPQQAVMAAEIAMEHHLGLTCDPVAGLVQVPCIERNAMGAVKAVNAAQLALISPPEKARVSLDTVIKTMNETAANMNSKDKETSLGGLAVNIPVGLAEC